MTRRAFTFGLLFTIREQNASEVISQIERDGREHNKVMDALMKRVKYVRIEGDAVGCGFLRKLSGINHKIGDGFEKLAEIYGGK